MSQTVYDYFFDWFRQQENAAITMEGGRLKITCGEKWYDGSYYGMEQALMNAMIHFIGEDAKK